MKKRLIVVMIGVVVAGTWPAVASDGDRAAASDQGRFDHSLWDSVVRQSVSDSGRVNYAKIKASDAFREYLAKLKATSVSDLVDDQDRLAFWINAYNALTIQGVLQTLPADESNWPAYRITDQKVHGKSLWKGIRFDVGGGQWTLDDIEHGILRKQDGLRDPRIHVALVCAARSCPPLWNHAYTGAAIKDQLAAAMRRFMSNPTLCTIDAHRRLIRISKVFRWYGSDFVSKKFSPHAKSIAKFLADYVPEGDTAAALRSHSWSVRYFDYDWKINIQQ